jgi:hypoxanthine phosphoribosyltransferase
MEYLILTWEDVYNLTLRLSERVVESGFKPDAVVGIARGGWIPARILSDVLYADTLQNIRIEYYSQDNATNHRVHEGKKHLIGRRGCGHR